MAIVTNLIYKKSCDVKNHLMEILFPLVCVECGKEGGWWCESCEGRSAFQAEQYCPVCFRTSSGGIVCATDKSNSSLDGLTALFSYQNQAAIAELIKFFKYQGTTDMLGLWEKVLKKWQGTSKFPTNFAWTIIPVPLHKRRERERGFNQATELAKILVKLYPQTTLQTKCLIRSRYTKQQAKLTRPERMQNMKNVFTWRGGTMVPKRVLLVDDIFTTGSTLQAAAQTLKEVGVEEVWGWVLARD
jgi:ComF family protein